MASFGKELAKHLSRDLGVTIKAAEESLNSFFGGEKPQPQKATVEEGHTCARIKRGKTEPCGAKAKRFLEAKGEWYCGGEKSGCYSIALKSAAGGGPPASKKVAKKDEEFVRTLLAKAKRLEMIDTTKVDTPNGPLYVNMNTMVAFDRDTEEAIGSYDEETQTLNPSLSEEQREYVEKNGLLVRD